MSSANKKNLVFNILQFLNQSIQDGSISSDDAEGIQVAIECIAEAFGVDPESASQKEQYSIKPASLQSIFDVFVRTKEKNASSGGAAAQPAAPPAAAATPTPAVPLSADQKAQAEALKAAGNSLMTQKKYTDAVAKYDQAIAIDSRNPVYFSNRAAAWGSIGDHQKAVEDAQSALAVEPTFVKAYSRLGHAHYSLSQFAESVEAYRKGLLIDPTNTNLKAALANAEARLPASSSKKDADSDEDSDPDEAPVAASSSRGAPPAGGMPDLSSLMNMMGGMGGGGAGGMPDFASMMKNPQLMDMAQKMMAGGGMDEILQNPSIKAMAERMQSTGQAPNMADLMADPSLREAAAKFGAKR